MRHRTTRDARFALALIAALAGTAATGAGEDSVRYTITVLDEGLAPRPERSRAVAVSESGFVVGEMQAASIEAFLWSPADGVSLLEDIEGGPDIAFARDVNTRGHAVGFGTPEPGATLAAIWRSPGRPVIVLGPGASEAELWGINEAGTAVGSARLGDRRIPTRWSANGTPSAMSATASGRAYAINAGGVAAGDLDDDGTRRAFRWDGTGEPALLPLPAGLGRSSVARGINARGDVVGAASGASGERAVLWTASGEIIEIGALELDAGGICPYEARARALAIDDQGVVVGVSASCSEQRAFIWDTQLGLRPLAPLVDADDEHAGIVILEARDIDASGHIAATGRIEGASRALLLAPAS